MGGAGSVQLSIFHPELFCVAGSWGGGMWREAEALLTATKKNAGVLKSNGYSVLLINGEKDRPDAFKTLVETLADLEIPHEVVVLPDTPHNLGLYYERAGEATMEFLGRGLER
jgi:endo-1,4-beta-xylanase